MALTPDDVVTKQFQHVRFKEGFDPDEVDDFLDEIVVEWRKTIAENDELKAKLAAYESGEAAHRRPRARGRSSRRPRTGSRRRGSADRRRSRRHRRHHRARPAPPRRARRRGPRAARQAHRRRQGAGRLDRLRGRDPRPRRGRQARARALVAREPHLRAAQLRARLPRAAAQLHRGQASRPRDHVDAPARRRSRPSASRPAFDRPTAPSSGGGRHHHRGFRGAGAGRRPVHEVPRARESPLRDAGPGLGDFLIFYLVRNPGAAFSLGEGVTWIFTIALAAVSVIIVWLAATRIRSRLWAVALGLLLGGVLGNLTDRLFREPGFAVGHVDRLHQHAVDDAGDLQRRRHLHRLDDDRRRAPRAGRTALRRHPRPRSRLRTTNRATPLPRDAPADAAPPTTLRAPRRRTDVESRSLPVPDGLDGTRVDAALAKMLGFSRTFAADVADAGGVSLDGRVLSKSDKLRGGAWLEVSWAPKEEPRIIPVEVPDLGDRVRRRRHRRGRQAVGRGRAPVGRLGGSHGARRARRRRLPHRDDRRGRAAGRRPSPRRRHHRVSWWSPRPSTRTRCSSAPSRSARSRRSTTRSCRGIPIPLSRHDRRAHRAASHPLVEVRGHARGQGLGHPLRDPRGVPRRVAARDPSRDRAHAPDPGAHGRAPASVRRRPALRRRPDRCRPGSDSRGSGCTPTNSRSRTRDGRLGDLHVAVPRRPRPRARGAARRLRPGDVGCRWHSVGMGIEVRPATVVRRREDDGRAEASRRGRVLVPELPHPVEGERRAAQAGARSQGLGAHEARTARECSPTTATRSSAGRRCIRGPTPRIATQHEDPARRRPRRVVGVVHPGAARSSRRGHLARAARGRRRVREGRAARRRDRGYPVDNKGEKVDLTMAYVGTRKLSRRRASARRPTRSRCVNAASRAC